MDPLVRIETWPPTDNPQEWLDYCVSQWNLDYGVIRSQPDGSIHFITGGWSENEAILDAMRENLLLDNLCWQSSHRGGLHIYKAPPKEDP